MPQETQIIYGAEELNKSLYIPRVFLDGYDFDDTEENSVIFQKLELDVTSLPPAIVAAMAVQQPSAVTTAMQATEAARLRTQIISRELVKRGIELAVDESEDVYICEDETIIAHYVAQGVSEPEPEPDKNSLPEPKRRARKKSTTDPEMPDNTTVQPTAPPEPEKRATFPQPTNRGKKKAKFYGPKKILDAVRASIELGEATLLVGATGVGKTTALKAIAPDYNAYVCRMSVNGSTGIEEMIGRWQIRDKETFWCDGLLLQAMKNGWWFVADEINAALADTLFCLQSLLDDDRSIRVVEKDGSIVEPHEDFRFFATMNPSNGDYAGTKELNIALLDRFATVIEIPYPKPADEIKILVEDGGIDEAQAGLMVDIANKIRKLNKEGTVMSSLSTRTLIYWAKFTLMMGNRDKAYAFTIRNKVNSEDAKIFADVVKAVTGEYDTYMIESDGVPPTSIIEEARSIVATATSERVRAEEALEKLATATDKYNQLADAFKNLTGSTV